MYFGWSGRLTERELTPSGVRGLSSGAQLVVQPCFREPPLSLDAARRSVDVACGRDAKKGSQIAAIA
jgi:hypothetical protein